jgi:hypothetical protein
LNQYNNEYIHLNSDNFTFLNNSSVENSVENHRQSTIENILQENKNIKMIFTDYLSVILILGGKWHLIWFLDWMKYNDKLQYLNTSSQQFMVWFALYNSKYLSANILRDYGFADSSNLISYKYKFLNHYENYKIIPFKGQHIYLKCNLYDHISINEFKKLFGEIHCKNYKKMIIGSDDSFSIFSENLIVEWNAEICYYLDFPKKIILLAISQLCTESNHLFCASIEKIQEQCKNICQNNKIQVLSQLYFINKKNEKKNYNHIYQKIIANIYFRREKTTECLICFENLRNGNTVSMLNCNHFFHKECINIWRKEKNQCPYCRKSTFNITNLLK